MPNGSILDRSIAQTPIAVVDTETTGLSPGGDRIVEVAVVRIEPGSGPELVLDTLINPRRRVSATEIHGITDADVLDAPTFRDLSPLLVGSLKDCVFAAYNVYFDVRFLESELREAGIGDFPPYLCLMYLRPMLGIGKRCTLADACKLHGISATDAHVAADDALTSSQLWPEYLARMRELGVGTFRQLAALHRYKFTSSFSAAPYSLAPVRTPAVRLKSRRTAAPKPASREMTGERAAAEYWEALKAALADLELTDDEIAYLRSKRRELRLTDDVLRWLHARAFAGILAGMSEDFRIDDREAQIVAQVSEGLARIGWSPGVSARRGDESPERPRSRGFFGWRRS